MLEYGSFLGREGDCATAETELSDALGILVKVYGGGHWRPAVARNYLALCMANRGRFTEGESLLLDSAARIRAQRAEDNRWARQARENTLSFYAAWGRPPPPGVSDR